MLHIIQVIDITVFIGTAIAALRRSTQSSKLRARSLFLYDMLRLRKVRDQVRLSEAIAHQIEDQIFRGQLKAGDMLPPETVMMKAFGVGRYTVREALRMLETSGLVRIKQGSQGGAVITKVSNNFVSDFLIKAIRFGEVTADDLSQFRLALEPPIAEILAGRSDIDSSIISQLEQNIKETKRLFEEGQITAFCNMDFHVLLAVATENPMFIILLNTLRAYFTLLLATDFNSVLPLRNERQFETIGHHEQILQSIINGDAVRARDLMIEHLTAMSRLFADPRMQKELKIITDTSTNNLHQLS